MKRCVATLLGSLFLVSCAAQSQNQDVAPTTQPGDPARSEGVEAEPKGYSQPAPQQQAPPPQVGGGMSVAPEDVDEATLSLDQAWQLLDQRQLQLSGRGDCSVACKALASMKRAADRICELTGGDGDRCKSARTMVEEAQRRVAERCGECASDDGLDGSTD